MIFIIIIHGQAIKFVNQGNSFFVKTKIKIYVIRFGYKQSHVKYIYWYYVNIKVCFQLQPCHWFYSIKGCVLYSCVLTELINSSANIQISGDQSFNISFNSTQALLHIYLVEYSPLVLTIFYFISSTMLALNFFFASINHRKGTRFFYIIFQNKMEWYQVYYRQSTREKMKK